jgi:hypothetical protein
MIKTFTIIGGGNLGHVIAGVLSCKEDIKVNILTNRPEVWHNEITVEAVDGKTFTGNLSKISSLAEDVIPESDVVLLCLPGYLIKDTLHNIKPLLSKNVFVGSVFSSTGFFFEAKEILSQDTHLWGFQRVPFISRVSEYGKTAKLLGYKPSYSIAIEQASDEEKELFRFEIERIFERPTVLLNNYLEASLTNSNPILHTARLYSLFSNWNESIIYKDSILFYESWDLNSAQLLIDMDKEFFSLLSVLPVSPNFLPTLLDYYESTDAESLMSKLSSIQGFKGIYAPMVNVGEGWIPDFKSRYFTEDFPFGLKYIWQLAKENNINTPTIDMVYNWGLSVIAK